MMDQQDQLTAKLDLLNKEIDRNEEKTEDLTPEWDALKSGIDHNKKEALAAKKAELDEHKER